MYTALLLALTPGGAALARTPSPNENNNTIPGTSLAHAAFEIALGSDAQFIERGRYSRALVGDDARVKFMKPGDAKASFERRLLNVWNLHDTSHSLRIVRVFHHRDVKVFFSFAEGDVGGAVARGNIEYV